MKNKISISSNLKIVHFLFLRFEYKKKHKNCISLMKIDFKVHEKNKIELVLTRGVRFVLIAVWIINCLISSGTALFQNIQKLILYIYDSFSLMKLCSWLYYIL